jgi:phospholipid transport system substrate-binding protein
MSLIPKFVMLLCALGFTSLAHPVYAAVSDPAVIQVQSLTTSLLKSMRAGSTITISDRYRNLEPVIEQVFDLPLMTRLSIGPSWEKFSVEQQKASIAAFRRYTVANYAYNFREFDGEKFEIEDNVLSRGAQKVVRTRLISLHDTPAILMYTMHEQGGVWKIIDVYYDGISELALRRSDFGPAVASGGAPALIAHLNKVADSLIK